MSAIEKELGITLEDENVHYNSAHAHYVEETLRLGQGRLSEDGSLVVRTGKHTGRSAGDKYVVKSEETKDTIWWENSLNEMSSEQFEKLRTKVINYFKSRDDLYITDRSVGALKEHNIGVRTICERPSHALFTQHLFREAMEKNGTKFDEKNDFLILHAPDLEIDPQEFGTQTDTVITTCFDTKTTIIVGTLYAGEIKKSMFSVMNYVLPEEKILPMHAGANRMRNKDVSVFFGLSGTGKTTLSTDEGTYLIGDDEHGMSGNGIFNFEGGCYAKTYKLSYETEPGIYNACNRFGAMMENVVMDEKTREVDLFDKSIAENGRASYPLDFIGGLERSSTGKVPNHIFFLTADAFGVLPPVSRLDKKQALFYFVLGYTAKLAGTEVGVTEPKATFSPCFGAPFMLRRPGVYAELLGEYLDKHDIKVWLVNTGWTGGPYGTGERFPLKTTRHIIRSIQNNDLDDVDTERDPIFGLPIPCAVDGIPVNVLNPLKAWDDEKAYTKKAQSLATSFHEQMQKFPEFYKQNLAGAPTYKG